MPITSRIQEPLINRVQEFHDPSLQEFKAASSHHGDDEFSPILAWAREQDERGDLVKTSEGKRHMKAHVAVLTKMLQSVSSNPLQDNGVEGIRVLQALVEGIARFKQEEKLDMIAGHIQENNFFQAAALVGKKGEFSTRDFPVGPESSDEVFSRSAQRKCPSRVRIALMNDRGLKIAELLGPKEEGRHSLMPLLSKLKPGNYSFNVWGVSAEEEIVDVHPIFSSEIKSVKQDDSQLLAFVGGEFSNR